MRTIQILIRHHHDFTITQDVYEHQQVYYIHNQFPDLEFS
jgi:hypothetical protein